MAQRDILFNDLKSATEEDEKLLTYTAPPLDAALEVTGHPVIELFIASTAEDGAFHAYLEDVGPDGSVTLVTEGVLRGPDVFEVGVATRADQCRRG